jgi:uncharacterized SAM-binding protein YcdF (DUF218 family)
VTVGPAKMSDRAMRGLRTKRGRRITVALFVVVVFAAFTARLFIFPDLNTPVHSDAIVVLGGTGLTPVETGVALADRGLAPMLVFSLVPTEICTPSRPTYQVVCFRANPLTTQGEARSIARLAARYHWHRIIVVAPRAQATRARLRVGRCYSGQVLIDGVPATSFFNWVHEIAYEWAALGKALVWQTSC